MAPLRESERKEEIRVLHMEIWDKMQSFDESYAESYYKICLKNLGKEEKEFFGPSLNMNSVDTDFFKSKGFWIAAFAGVLIIVLLVFFILWFSLLVE
ncbi:hypothetical protein [Paenibacillus sp. FSL H7-0331]|jgi:hypothetical protein|uniref:hypothetical protein n=2 Tax=Paenibacillus sp. FSL H7-0331 TaxID=1920421 RepID=UPI00096C3F7A|nr:hypothetical protein [Paenibacillus sp. FSL H7-0331]OMF00006.1 hypothetical protein BK127_38685 [Paenibacillus sp. FSL H7-0331]